MQWIVNNNKVLFYAAQMKYFYLPASAIRYDPVTKQEVLTQKFAQMSPVLNFLMFINISSDVWLYEAKNEKQPCADANENFRPRPNPLRTDAKPNNSTERSHQELCYQQPHDAGLASPGLTTAKFECRPAASNLNP